MKNNSTFSLIKYVACLFYVSTLSAQQSSKFEYNQLPLVLTENSLSDGLGAFKTEDLPIVNPKCTIELNGNASPITNKLWKIALRDCELNINSNAYGTYFAAGRRYTDRVYTRDISYSGILGLNALYPNEMLKSIQIARNVSSQMGYKVSTEEVISEIDAPWNAITDDRKQIMAQFKCNSITRRTDDVVWIWAIDDLFKQHPEIADWNWYYNRGKNDFNDLFNPWFDKTDGLYRGQNTFHDIQSSAYPKGYSQADCVLLKSTSTNCLYYKALLSMANVAKMCNLPKESAEWTNKAKALKKAIKKELMHSEGTFSYYKDRNGKLMPNQHNLGTAFAIIFGIVEGADAIKAIENYPTTEFGTPLQYPFVDNKGDHNQAAWPFCDTFFLIAKEIAYKKDFTGYNAALLARTMGTKLSDKIESDWGGFGSFHEKVPLPSGIISGSGAQLWTAASFLNVCLRANLVDLKK